MARTRRVKSENDAFYHVMSRIAGKRFLLKDPRIKRIMVDSLRISAEFSGVKIGSYVIMDDYFHLTVEVPTIETALVEIAKNLGTVPEKFKWKIPEEEVMRRLGVLKGEKRAKEIAGYIKMLRKSKQKREAEAEIDRYRVRMQDLSQFVKTFKEVFNIRFKKLVEYSGSIWGGRFKSTIVGNEHYFNNCRKYIEYNPVRAEMVATPEEYPWSSAGGAARGEAFAVKCRNYTSSLIIGSADGNGDSPRKQGEESVVDVTKRVPQVGLGKILGGKEFVKASALEFSAALYGRRCRPKQVGGWAFSSHGHAEVAA